MNTPSPDQPQALPPFEFEIYGAQYKICGAKTERRFSGVWVRIDQGDPDRIGRFIKAAVFLLMIGLFNVAGSDDLNRIGQATRGGRTEMHAL